MPKNIVIFSDGTGQRAGLTFDERRSNIYKLFRATRSGPDSKIDPAMQITFYDAGIGTASPGAGWLGRSAKWIYNKVCQATGLGLTTNLVETYAAIIREWERGDRIFLFGFSRGAYTVRLLGGVLSHCGVPTKQPDSDLAIDEAGSKKIAHRAVTHVYQHCPSKAETKEKKLTDAEKTLLDQRKLLAEEFRQQYGSFDIDNLGQSNTVPHFIGVFDTVASMSHPTALGIISLLTLTVVTGLIALLAWAISFIGGEFLPTFYWIFFIVFIFSIIGYLGSLAKFPGKIGKYSWWQTARFFTEHMHFEDTELSGRVLYARHALAIDETRALFRRVPWTGKGLKAGRDEHGIVPFKQVWFAGVHADIGGGYLETESRLSDASLKWMLEDVRKEGIKLQIDPAYLNLFDFPDGRQHDEYARSRFWRLAGKEVRGVPPNDDLHPTVERRYRAGRVKQYDKVDFYRPANLAEHEDVVKWLADIAKNGDTKSS